MSESFLDLKPMQADYLQTKGLESILEDKNNTSEYRRIQSHGVPSSNQNTRMIDSFLGLANQNSQGEDEPSIEFV